MQNQETSNTKKRGRSSETNDITTLSSLVSAASSSNDLAQPSPKRLKIITTSLSSSQKTQVATVSSSSSTSLTAIKPDPHTETSSYVESNPLDFLSSAALYNPESIAPEPNDAMQVDEVPVCPLNSEPVARIVSLHEYCIPLRQKREDFKFSKFKDLAVEFVNGAIEIDCTKSAPYARALMLAGILENKNSDKAKKFMKNVGVKARIELLNSATLDLLKFGTKEAVDLAVELGFNLLFLNRSNMGENILHFFAKTIGRTEMLKHVIEKIGKDEAIKLTLYSRRYKNCPLTHADGVGNEEVFNILFALISAEDLINHRNPDIGSNILHEVTVVRDDSKMLKHVIEKIGNDAAIKLALQTDENLDTPLLNAARYNNKKNFSTLFALISAEDLVNWRNPISGSNILHESALARDNGSMLKRVIEKIGNDAAIKLAKQANKKGDTPFTDACSSKDLTSICILNFLNPNWQKDLDILHKVLLIAKIRGADLYKQISEKYSCSLDGAVLRVGNTTTTVTNQDPFSPKPQQVLTAATSKQPASAPTQPVLLRPSQQAQQEAPPPLANPAPTLTQMLATSGLTFPKVLDILSKLISEQKVTTVKEDMLKNISKLKALHSQHEKELKQQQNLGSSSSNNR